MAVQSLSEWLTTPSADPMRNLARAQAELGLLAFSEQVKSMTERLRALSDEVRAINTLLDKVRSFKPKVTSDGKVADAAYTSKLGNTVEESAQLVEQIRAFIQVEDTDIFRNKTPWELTQATFDKWESSLQTKSDDLNAKTQQLQPLLQQSNSRFNNTMEAAADIVGKIGRASNEIANKMGS